MSAINWTEEVTKRKDDLIRDTQQFYKLKVCGKKSQRKRAHHSVKV